jgi:hypothetical protein
LQEGQEVETRGQALIGKSYMRRYLNTAAALVAVAVGLAFSPAAAVAAPAVEDAWVSAVTATAVDLNGSVNPDGLSTTARFEYLTAAAYEANLSASRDGFFGATSSPAGSGGVNLGAGTAAVSFTRHIGLLTAATAYRYRVVATNSSGTAYGPVRWFATTESTPVFELPDSRAWEMVSPADKGGGEIQRPGEILGGGIFQAAATGPAVTYGSRTSFAGGAGSPGASQYLGQRTDAGWSTANITPPTLAGAYGEEPDGVPFQLFSGDLGRNVLVWGSRCAEEPCPRQLVLRDSAGTILAGTPARPDLRFAGANSALTQIVVSSCAALAPEAIEVPAAGGCDPSAANLYRWAGGTLTLINLLPAMPFGTPGATLAAPGGAISEDGSRVYFEFGGNLFLRAGNTTVAVDGAAGGGGSFETASADGSLAFFTKDGHLYRFSAGSGTATDLTPGGEVEGVLGATPDGTHLYYATADGLYLRKGASATKIAAGADASNFPPATGAARVAANGNLAFLSSEPLTGFDNAGNAQAFHYSPASGSLTCASCNPNGARALGATTIPGAPANGIGPTAARAYKPRALSAAGNRLFFQTPDKLASADTNGALDVYQWEAQGTGSCQRQGGCIALISSGRSAGGATFVDASADGAETYFLTDGSLVPTDPGLVDLYNARVGGGFPVPPVPIACLGDACQPVPSAPDDTPPATLIPRAEGNPPLRIQKPKQKAKKKKNAKKKKAQQRKKKAKKKAQREAQKQGKRKGARR